MSLEVAVPVVFVSVVVGTWLFSAIVTPERCCRWCKGTGKNWWSTEDRKGDCLFCGGEPWRPTRGARLVRRIFRRDRWGK